MLRIPMIANSLNILFYTFYTNKYLDAEPLDVDDSQDVFMMDDGETPPPEISVIHYVL